MVTMMTTTRPSAAASTRCTRYGRNKRSVSATDKMDKTLLMNANRRVSTVLRRSATVDSASLESTSSSKSDSDDFDWFSAWYPMRPVSFLDPTEPNELKLLGRKLVAF